MGCRETDASNPRPLIERLGLGLDRRGHRRRVRRTGVRRAPRRGGLPWRDGRDRGADDHLGGGRNTSALTPSHPRIERFTRFERPWVLGGECHVLTFPGTFLEGAAYHPVTAVQGRPAICTRARADERDHMTAIQQTGDRVLANVERVIVGKHNEVRFALVALLCRGHLLIEDVPGTGKTVLAKAIAKSLGCTFRRIQFTPDLLPVRRDRPVDLQPEDAGVRVPAGPDHEPGRPRRRDQPRDAEDAVRAARVHGGAPGHGRRHDLPDARPVPRHRDPEPDRVRGHVRAARGPARPVHAPDPPRLPAAGRGGGDPRRAEAPRTRSTTSRRSCSVEELHGDAARGARHLRRPDRRRLHRPARQRHARPRRHLPRRVAARVDRAVPRRPGARRPARPRLRHPGRRQGPRRGGARAPADHQDELVDPRRPACPGDPRAARVDVGRRGARAGDPERGRGPRPRLASSSRDS